MSGGVALQDVAVSLENGGCKFLVVALDVREAERCVVISAHWRILRFLARLGRRARRLVRHRVFLGG